MVAIRRAKLDDAETLAWLGAATFTETFGHLYKKEDLSVFLEKSHSRTAYEVILADPAMAVWLAETETGEAVGYAVAGPCSLPVPNMPENSGELARLYLLKEHQGGGLGPRMAEAALEWLKENFEYIYLSVYAENFRAQRLYQRLGFVKIHDYFYMVGNHADPEWIMEWRGEC